MSEITRLLTKELERLREENRQREARLTELFRRQAERDEIVTERLKRLSASHRNLTSDLQAFERRLNALAGSLKKS